MAKKNNNVVNATGVTLNDINLDNNDLKLPSGVLSSFISKQLDVVDFGIDDAKKYTDYDVTFSRFRDPNLDRAKNQSRTEQTINALGRIGLEGVIGESISGIGSLGELLLMPFEESETDFSNAITRLGENIKESSREALPIYRENPDTTFDFGDFAWWADNSVSIGSTLGLLIPSTGAVKGASALGKGLSTLGKANILTKTGKFGKAMSKALQLYDTTGDATKYWSKVIGTSVGMRHAENFGESLQVYNSTKEEAIQMFNNMDEDQFQQWKINNPEITSDSKNKDREGLANHIANKAGWRTYQLDASNLMFDVLQVMPLFKGFKYNTRTKVNPKKVSKAHYASMGQELTKDVSKKLFTQRLGKSITQGTIAQQLSEGVEETINAISAQEGSFYGKQLLGTSDDKNFNERLSNYLKDPTTWEQAFWGVMGGIAFSGGVSGLNKAHNIIKGVPYDKSETLRVAEIQGRMNTLSKGSTLMNVVDNNINPYTREEFIGTKDQIESEKEKVRNNIISDISLSLGINASKHGNVGLLLEQLQSDKFKEEIVESYGLSTTEEVSDVINTITDNVLNAERLYKKYYNRFATANVNPAIKDLLINDAIDYTHNSDRINEFISDNNDKLIELKNDPDYISILDSANKDITEGKPLKSVEDSISNYAIQLLNNITSDEIFSDKEITDKEALDVRLEKYKNNLRNRAKELTDIYTPTELDKMGINEEIIQLTASNLINEMRLEDNTEEFNKLLSNPKVKARQYEEEMKQVLRKDIDDKKDKLNKAVDDTIELDEMENLSKQIDNIASENEPFRSEFNAINNRLKSKITNTKRDINRRKSAVKAKESYIKELKDNVHNMRIRNIMAKRSNAKFIEQFNEEDLKEIDNVISDIKSSTKEQPVEPTIEPKPNIEKLGDEFIEFINKDFRNPTIAFYPIFNIIKEQASSSDTIKLSSDHIQKLEEFKDIISNAISNVDNYSSLGSVYKSEKSSLEKFNNSFNNLLKGKTIENIDETTPQKKEVSDDIITKDELVTGIKNIANKFNAYDSLKSEVLDNDENVGTGDNLANKIEYGVSIIKLLGLRNNGLGRNDVAKDLDYSFGDVLSFIYNDVDSRLVENNKFVDTLRNIFNIAVNEGLISKNNYVADRVDTVAFINNINKEQFNTNNDVSVFISSISSIRNQKQQNGDIIISKEKAKAFTEISNLDIGDEVQVSIDIEKSKANPTDALKAAIKVTKNNTSLFHLNQLYNVNGEWGIYLGGVFDKNTESMKGGVLYNSKNNWVDVLVSALTEGKFVKEYKSLRAIRNKQIESNNEISFRDILENEGKDLINSDIIHQLVNHNRSKPITRLDDRVEFDTSLKHILDVIIPNNTTPDFNINKIINSVNEWNSKIKSDIINGVRIRSFINDNGGEPVNVKISNMSSGAFISSMDKGIKSYNRLDDTYSNVEDLVLMHTVSDRNDRIQTINGKDNLIFDGKFNKGTIYTVGITPTGPIPMVTYTTDIVDDRLTDKGKDYNNKLLEWATSSINELVISNGEFTDSDLNNLTNDLNNHILGISTNTKLKKLAISFKDKYGNSYTLTIGKTISTMYINGKNSFNSGDGDFYDNLKTSLSKCKRNLPISKVNGKQTMPSGSDYIDLVTGERYNSFTEYAVDTELLITPFGAVKDNDGNIISHTVPSRGAYDMNILLDSNSLSKIERKVKKETKNIIIEEIDSIISEDSDYKELFDMAKASGVTFSNEAIDSEGYAEINKDTLVVKPTVNFNNVSRDQQFKLLAHEAIHGITLNKITDEHRERLLDIDDDIRAAYENGELDDILTESELNTLRKVFKAIEGKSGLGIGDEVLTYAFTNKAYAKALNNVKSTKPVDKGKTLWDKFINLVASMLPGTKLSEVKNIMDEIMGITTTEIKEEISDVDVSEDGFSDLYGESLISDQFESEGLFAEAIDGYSSLGMSISEYMRTKNKQERSLLRDKLNNGIIVLRCK